MDTLYQVSTASVIYPSTFSLHVISPQSCSFSGEEILIISLTKCATGEAWIHMIPSKFGGYPRECSFFSGLLTSYLHVSTTGFLEKA